MIGQIDLVAGIMGLLAQLGHVTLETRQTDAIIRAANGILAELERPHRGITPGMGLSAWWNSDETGLSSMAMARHLNPVGLPPADPPQIAYAVPLDSDDFGRCVGLLTAAPDLRPHLPILASLSEPWARLVAEWDALETLWTGGEFGKLNVRLRELIG